MDNTGKHRKNRRAQAVLFAFFAALLCCRAEKAAAQDEPSIFVTNSGKKYHVDGCSALRKSKIAVSLADALKSGYEPCGVCDPPAPASPAARPGGGETGAGGMYRLNAANLKSIAEADPALMLKAEVVAHVDGDTVRVRIPNPPAGISTVETIRMVGVDTPETVHPSKPVEWFGKEASDFTKKALLGKPVLLAFDWDTRDRYGRLLVYIFTEDGRCHNAELVRSGYAHAYTRFTFHFMEEFRAFEREARERKRGLWGER